jgi:hypothetical protein
MTFIEPNTLKRNGVLPVVWLARGDVPVRCRWDEMHAEDIITGAQKRSPLMPPVFHVGAIHPSFTHAVVCFPAGAHQPEDVDWLNEQLDSLQRVILFLTSDEAQSFPSERITHAQCRFWVMLPRPEKEYAPDTVFLTEGSGRAWLYADPDVEKDLEWVFAGQVNHARRKDAVSALSRSRIRPNVLRTTPGFLEGLDRSDYLALMARAKMAPAPAGVASQSSFRAIEALEMGAVPILDGFRADGKGRGYWTMTGVPGPIVDHWPNATNVMAEVRDDWHREVSATHGAWHVHRRELGRTLARQARWLQGEDADPMPRAMTVVIPTSPIPSHPSLEVIDNTIRSIRERTDAEILVMVDGVRREQEHRREDYERYVRRLLLAAESHWENVTPLVHTEHLHQAEMLRRALGAVDSEFILYVEHDTPLINEIDFDEMIEIMWRDQLNVLRFHHESHILPDHEWLMIRRPRADATPWRATMQWSQRPHLARVDFYRELLNIYFHPDARTMVEDIMYGVCANTRKRGPDRIWEKWRLAIYHPEGNIQRSDHSDGRGGDPKYDNRYRYFGEGKYGKAPFGAPNPDVGLLDE